MNPHQRPMVSAWVRHIACSLLFACFLGLSSSASAWVAYKSKSGSFRLEVSGYVKNFFAIQTGMARFLPEEVPQDLKGLDTLFRSIYPNQPQANLGEQWKTFRQDLNTSAQDQLWFRLGIKMKMGSSATLQIAYEIRPWAGSQPSMLLQKLPALGSALSGGLFGSDGGGAAGFGAFTFFDDRYLDFPSVVLDRSGFRLQHALDRLFFSYSFEALDMTIGRQPISFGVGRVFRPNDVLAPFSPYEFDTEQRRGVDAIKLEIPLGDVSELMIVAAIQRLYPSCQRSTTNDINVEGTPPAGCNPNATRINYWDDPSPAGIARFKWNVSTVDMFVMAGYVHQDIVGGLGISASIFGMGLQAEFLYRYPIVKPEDQHPGGLWSLSVNAEYNIAKIKLLLGLSYFHQSVGSTDPKRYLKVAQGHRHLRGESFLLGTDYLALYWQWELHPLVSFNGSIILNLLDPSAVFAPTFTINPIQDLHLLVGAYIGAGAFPTLGDNNKPNLALQSEFGSFGAMVLVGLRYYY